MKDYPTQTFYYELIKRVWFLDIEFHVGKGLYEPPFGLAAGGLTSATEWNLAAKGAYVKLQRWIGGLGVEAFLRLTWKR